MLLFRVGRVRVQRRVAERLKTTYIVEGHTAHISGVGSHYLQTPFAAMPVTLTPQRYIQNVLQTYMLSRVVGISAAIFQHDNAWSHTARISRDFLHNVTTLACTISRFIVDRTCAGPIGTLIATARECSRCRNQIAVIVVRYIEEHYTLFL